jgi:hypothetical protein
MMGNPIILATRKWPQITDRKKTEEEEKED